MKPRRTIVVVDDDEVQLHLLEEFLDASSFQVYTAATGEEGLQRIMDMQPDLVILDQVLPDMTGSDVCAQMRASAAMRHIPIILCSAHKFSAFDKVIGLRSGADDYLVRPFDLSELLARIEAIIRRTNIQPRADTLAGIHAVLGKPAAPVASPPAPAAVKHDRPITPQRSAVVPPKETPVSAGPPNVFKRAWQILNHPWVTFSQLNEHDDFLIATVLVMGTPVISSFSKLFGTGASFDNWIGGFSLGVVLHVVMWLGIAGALHMTLPFQGINLPMKSSLTVAGLSAAPRFLEAILRLLYLGLASIGLRGEHAVFASGLDMFFGSSSTGFVSFFSHIGIFDFWSTALTLIGVWELSHAKRPKWNTVTILVGITCLLFSALSSF